MKRVVRLTENDLTRIVKRVIKEQDEAELDNEIEMMPEDADPGVLQSIIDKIEAKGEDIQKFIERKKREGKRWINKLENNLDMKKAKLRFKFKKFMRTTPIGKALNKMF